MSQLIKPPNCTCAYPNLIARNMCGHTDPCPVYREFMAKLEANKKPLDAPRRCYLQLLTPAERAIHDAIQAVEEAGCHPFLTEAVVLLRQAFNKVADHTDAEVPTQLPGVVRLG